MVGWPLDNHQCIWMVERTGRRCLCVCVEPLFGASRVDIMKFLFLLRLDVLILLHPAGIFHISPVGRQNHKVVDLIKDKDNLYWKSVLCLHHTLLSGKKYILIIYLYRICSLTKWNEDFCCNTKNINTIYSFLNPPTMTLSSQLPFFSIFLLFQLWSTQGS